VIGVDDDELLAELRMLFAEADPVDPMIFQQARLAYGWRTIDADLAELAYDSLADRDVMAALRDGGLTASGPRLLGFGTDLTGEDDDAVSVEVEVVSDGAGAVLLGQIVPPGPATVQVARLGPAGRSGQTVRADPLGRFRIAPAPTGPARLRIETGDRVVETSWVSYAAENRIDRH